MLVTLHHGLQLELVTLNIVLSVVTDEPVEFKKQLVRIHDFKKITDRSKRIYEIFFNLIRKKTKRRQHATCLYQQHWDLNCLCPEISQTL